MYDWIPMEFDFEFRDRSMFASELFHCIANKHDRHTFTVYDARNELCNDAYDIQSLLIGMKNGSTINGMTMDELKCKSVIEEHEIDISNLI